MLKRRENRCDDHDVLAGKWPVWFVSFDASDDIVDLDGVTLE